MADPNDEFGFVHMHLEYLTLCSVDGVEEWGVWAAEGLALLERMCDPEPSFLPATHHFTLAGVFVSELQANPFVGLHVVRQAAAEELVLRGWDAASALGLVGFDAQTQHRLLAALDATPSANAWWRRSPLAPGVERMRWVLRHQLPAASSDV